MDRLTEGTLIFFMAMELSVVVMLSLVDLFGFVLADCFLLGAVAYQARMLWIESRKKPRQKPFADDPEERVQW